MNSAAMPPAKITSAVNTRTVVHLLLWPFVFCCSASRALAASELSFEGLALTPLSRVVSSGVLVLGADVANSAEATVEGTIVVTVEEFPKLQSARRFVLEPGQRERLELFVPIPELLPNQKSLNLAATMLNRLGQREVILDQDGKPARHTMTVKVGEGRTMAIAMQAKPPSLPAWYWPPALPQTDYEFAVAARIEAGHDRTAAAFDEHRFPLNESDWAGLDLFVLADPSPLEDGAIVEALRRYVASGGRLWIMLDHVPCALVRPLLGPTHLCEEVERVELNEFLVEPIGSAVKQAEADRRVKLSTSVPMVRVVQAGGRVRFEVAGWPAAIDMNVGYGQVLLTTLDSQAWIEPRTRKLSKDVLFMSSYQPREWARLLAVDANEPRPALPLRGSVTYPLQQIGNPVLPRQLVAAALLGFFICLAGLGGWFAYVGKLTMIAVVAPAAAALVSCSLIAAASWMRRDIPESLSKFQLVDIAADGNSAAIREQAAVYLSSSSAMQLECDDDGMAMTSNTFSSGAPRYSQTDFQKWQVDNEAWPTGTWRYESSTTLPTEDLVVQDTLSQTGLQLHLPENLTSRLEDAVLSFVPGDPMLCEPVAEGLHVNNAIYIGDERWISGSFLSDEQQRRLELYRQYFQADKQVQLPFRRLYGWTEPWKGSHWNRELKPSGSALVALPIVLERPAAGSDILVPHGLIRLQRDLTQVSVTSAFDDRTGRWRESNSSGTEADMEFVLPPEVIPMAVSAIDLELEITAPQRDVTLSVQSTSGKVELARLNSPTLPWSTTITDAAVLQTMHQGRLLVTLSVSESRDKDSLGIASNMIHWQLDRFHASVRGSVLAKSGLSPINP